MLKVFKFYANWCGPCKIFTPIIEEVKKEHPDVEFKDINVDHDEEIASKFGIMAVPSVVIVKDDLTVARFNGVQTKDYVNDIINKYK